MSTYPENVNSVSFAGRGVRIDFFTFKDKNVFEQLTAHGVDEGELDELISEMEEVYSETGGSLDYCSLAFDDGSEFPITEALCKESTVTELPKKFKYLLIRTEAVRGTFDAWNLDGDDFDPDALSIEKECVKLPGDEQLNLVHVFYQDDYGEGADYFGSDMSYMIFTSEGESREVLINSES
jgi:hypothetical protein